MNTDGMELESELSKVLVGKKAGETTVEAVSLQLRETVDGGPAWKLILSLSAPGSNGWPTEDTQALKMLAREAYDEVSSDVESALPIYLDISTSLESLSNSDIATEDQPEVGESGLEIDLSGEAEGEVR